MVLGVLVHELGHHATSATRFSVAAQWLAAPWRCWTRVVIGICAAIIGRRRSARAFAAAVLIGVAISAVLAAQRTDWATAAVLWALSVCAVGVPLLEAASYLRAERAADRFAADAGAGYELACALPALNGMGRSEPLGLIDRLLAKHPEAQDRIAALLTFAQPVGGSGS